jgi:MFS family permease
MSGPSSAAATSLLRHPDFARLWAAETVSQLGTQVSALAIPFVAIEILHASTFEVALLNVVDFLPFLLIGLPAGVWVDRLRRRPVMIAGDLGRAAALATIPVAYLAGVLTVVQLYAVGFVVGILTVFFDIAYQSYLPSVVARDQLQEGNAKLEISRAGAQVVGPGLAGILIGVLRAPIAVALDALSFLGSALFLFLIRRPEPPPRPHDPDGGPRPGMRREIAEGLRYVVGHPYLRSIAACTATLNLFGTMAGAVLLVFAVRELGMTAEAIGLAFSIGATGALLGAFLANRISSWLGVGPTIIVFAAIAGPALLPLALATVGTPMPTLVGFVGGLSAVVYNVAQVSLRQAITPTRMQGRMNATMRWFVWGTIPIGGVLGGVLGSVLGVRATMIIGIAGATFAVLPVLFSPVRGIRGMPAPADDEMPAPEDTEASAGDGPA